MTELVKLACTVPDGIGNKKVTKYVNPKYVILIEEDDSTVKITLSNGDVLLVKDMAMDKIAFLLKYGEPTK